MASVLAPVMNDAEAGRLLWNAAASANEGLTEETFALSIVSLNYTAQRQAAAYLMMFGTASGARNYALQVYFAKIPWWRRALNAVAPALAGVTMGLVAHFIILPQFTRWTRRPLVSVSV